MVEFVCGGGVGNFLETRYYDYRLLKGFDECLFVALAKLIPEEYEGT